MNPENANIEVLAPDLWAVRFSWISMIPQIKFTRITDTPYPPNNPAPCRIEETMVK